MLHPNVWSDGVSAKGAYMTAGWQARFEHSKSAASILSKRQETTAFSIMSHAVFDNSKSDLDRAIGTATCLHLNAICKMKLIRQRLSCIGQPSTTD